MMATQSIFEFVLARPVIDGDREHPHLVQMIWHAPQQGSRLVQAYVDGELAAVTRRAEDRDVTLHVDRRMARLVELLAIDPQTEDVHAAYPEALATHTQWPRMAEVTVLRDESLPLHTHIAIAVDGQLHLRAPLWTWRDARGGLGGVLGHGALGLDGTSCPGLGRGSMGLGHLGIDGEPWRATLRDLTPGEHELTITPVNEAGDAIGAAVTRSISIASLNADASPVTIHSDFTLTL